MTDAVRGVDSPAVPDYQAAGELAADLAEGHQLGLFDEPDRLDPDPPA